VEVHIPEPNKALAAVLLSGEIRAAVEDRGHTAQMLFQAEVAKRSGRLAATARVQTEIGGVRNDRWVSHMIVGGQGALGTVAYGAAHQFGHWQDQAHQFDGDQELGESGTFVEGAHDLNRVLEQLASY